MAPPHKNNRNPYSHAPSLDSAQAVAQVNASRPRAAANTSPFTNVTEGYGRQRVTSNTPAYGPYGSSSREPSLMRGFGGGSTRRAPQPPSNHHYPPPNALNYHGPQPSNTHAVRDYGGFPQQLPAAPRYHQPSSGHAFGSYGGFPPSLPAAPTYYNPYMLPYANPYQVYYGPPQGFFPASSSHPAPYNASDGYHDQQNHGQSTQAREANFGMPDAAPHDSGNVARHSSTHVAQSPAVKTSASDTTQYKAASPFPKGFKHLPHMDKFKKHVLAYYEAHPPGGPNPEDFWDTWPMSNLFFIDHEDGTRTWHIVMGGFGLATSTNELLDSAREVLKDEIVPWMDRYLRDAAKHSEFKFKLNKVSLYKGDNPIIQKRYRTLPGIELEFPDPEHAKTFAGAFYDGNYLRINRSVHPLFQNTQASTGGEEIEQDDPGLERKASVSKTLKSTRTDSPGAGELTFKLTEEISTPGAEGDDFIPLGVQSPVAQKPVTASTQGVLPKHEPSDRSTKHTSPQPSAPNPQRTPPNPQTKVLPQKRSAEDTHHGVAKRVHVEQRDGPASASSSATVNEPTVERANRAETGAAAGASKAAKILEELYARADAGTRK